MLNGNLHLVDLSQNLPAGMVSKSVEFFVDANDMHCQTEGNTYHFKDFPQWVKDLVDADMTAHPKKVDCLVDAGILDTDSQMKQYLFCLYGGHDTHADINEAGQMQPSEYVNCGLRGTCKYEGKLCNAIVLANGILTKSEINVLKAIGECLLDKEIADSLNISLHTVRHHKDSIAAKSGLERKPALVGLAYKLGLIQ